MKYNNAGSVAFQDILESPLFQSTVERYIGSQKPDLITRPACFIIRAKKESKVLVKRLIIIPPHGYTADAPTLMNPHPEALKARARILGKIDPTKKGYKPSVREVELKYANNNSVPTQEASAYAEYSETYGGTELKSWKNWFYVVKKNRWGDFHNLTNTSDEWVVIVIEKWLTDIKPIKLGSYLKHLPAVKAKQLKLNLRKIQHAGDEIFVDKHLIADVMKTPHEVLIPVLIQMLNVTETGRHESCTFFALLLKAARKNKTLVKRELQKAINLESAPYYYLEDLERKLKLSKIRPINN